MEPLVIIEDIQSDESLRNDSMNGTLFYAIDGKQHGPVSWDELKQLAVRDSVKRTDKVWSKGMEAWQPACELKGLFDDLPPELPPEDSPVEHGRTPEPKEVTRPSTELVAQSADKTQRVIKAAPVQSEILNQSSHLALRRRNRARVAILACVVILACGAIFIRPVRSLLEHKPGATSNEGFRELKQKAVALNAEMIANIRKGLADLGTTNGVPFLGNNEDIQKYWGAAVEQATQLAGLII